MKRDKLRKEVKNVYKNFWKPIFGFGGLFNFKQVKKELSDFYVCMEEVSKVYMYITDGMISKPNTMAFEVNGLYDDFINTNFISVSDLQDLLRIFDKMTKKEIKLELESML